MLQFSSDFQSFYSIASGRKDETITGYFGFVFEKTSDRKIT